MKGGGKTSNTTPKSSDTELKNDYSYGDYGLSRRGGQKTHFRG